MWGCPVGTQRNWGRLPMPLERSRSSGWSQPWQMFIGDGLGSDLCCLWGGTKLHGTLRACTYVCNTHATHTHMTPMPCVAPYICMHLGAHVCSPHGHLQPQDGEQAGWLPSLWDRAKQQAWRWQRGPGIGHCYLGLTLECPRACCLTWTLLLSQPLLWLRAPPLHRLCGPQTCPSNPAPWVIVFSPIKWG